MTSRHQYQVKLDDENLARFLDRGARAKEAIVRIMVGFKAKGPYFSATHFGVLLFALGEPHLPHDSGIIQRIKEAVEVVIGEEITP